MHFEKNERGDEELPDGDFGAPPSETWEADRAVGEADEKEVTQRVHQLMKYGELG